MIYIFLQVNLRGKSYATKEIIHTTVITLVQVQHTRSIPYSFNSLQWRRCVNQWFTHVSRNSTLISWINTPTQMCHSHDNQVRWLRLRVMSLQWVKWIGYSASHMCINNTYDNCSTWLNAFQRMIIYHLIIPIYSAELVIILTSKLKKHTIVHTYYIGKQISVLESFNNMVRMGICWNDQIQYSITSLADNKQRLILWQ